MKKILDEKTKKEFLMERNGYSVKYTIMNMGDYVGHKYRQWYEDTPEYWETMFITVESEDPLKCLSGEFSIDSNGSFLNLIIKDKDDNKRVISAMQGMFGASEEDYEFYYGKGIHIKNGEVIRDVYIEKDQNEDSIINLGKEYYYDEERKEFVDEEGNVATKSILTNPELGNLFRTAALQVSRNFKSRDKSKELDQLDDVEISEL